MADRTHVGLWHRRAGRTLSSSQERREGKDLRRSGHLARDGGRGGGESLNYSAKKLRTAEPETEGAASSAGERGGEGR